MSGRKYYCFCDSNCKFETMTKEQILAAIAQAAENGLTIDEDAAFITKVKESNAGGMVTFWVGTQAQYNALEKVDKNCLYIITDSTKEAALESKLNAALEEIKQVAEAPKQWIKLWENTTNENGMYSPFEAQTVALDLNKYAMVLVQFVEYGLGGVSYSQDVLVEKVCSIGSGKYNVATCLEEYAFAKRYFKVNKDGVEFLDVEQTKFVPDELWGDALVENLNRFPLTPCRIYAM